jgi:outer membrane protein OmpA-like peptidoglycan-associated protein/outer membrane murein-binding lipoprotein Lpp
MSALGLGGCASQEFVRQEVGQQSERVSSLEAWFKAINQGMDANANRIRDAEARIGRAEQAGTAAVARLDETRQELQFNGQRLDRLVGDISGAKHRIDTMYADVERAQQRLDGQDARLNTTSRRLEGAVAGLALAEGRIAALQGSMPKTLQAALPDRGFDERGGSPPATAAALSGPTLPASETAGLAAARAGESSAATGRPDDIGILIGDLKRKLQQQSVTLTAALDRLAGLEAGMATMGRRDQEREAALKAAARSLGDLQTETSRLQGQGEANAQAVVRIDQRLSGIDGDLANARKRVEAGEKGLAESGLRLTLVQDLLNNQADRLARNEIENGKASTTAREALERARLAGKLAEGKLVFETTLTDEVANFGVQDARLNERARGQLNDFASRLKAENRGAYIEIQGHTDSSGHAEANLRLSRERAMAVRDYLHREAKIPLHLLAVAAYGESRPVADNRTREGRGKNRRVVLVVLR